MTADADGQHLAADVRRVVERLEQSPSTLVLGSRAFDGTVPLRNRLGNAAHASECSGCSSAAPRGHADGLRGIPRGFLAELMQLDAGRYEFELEMLIRAPERGLAVEELRIETSTARAQSHFNPLRDSLRISSCSSGSPGFRS